MLFFKVTLFFYFIQQFQSFHFFIFLFYFYRGKDTTTDKMFNDIMDSIINNASKEEIEIIFEKLMITLLTIIMIIRSKENYLIHSVVLLVLLVVKTISLNLAKLKKVINVSVALIVVKTFLQLLIRYLTILKKNLTNGLNLLNLYFMVIPLNNLLKSLVFANVPLLYGNIKC